MCHNKCRSRNIWELLCSVLKYIMIFTLKTQNFHRLPFSTGINISFLSWKDANVMQLYLLWRRSKNLVIFTSLSNTNFELNQVETKQKINTFCRKNMWRHRQNIDRAIIILQHHLFLLTAQNHLLHAPCSVLTFLRHLSFVRLHSNASRHQFVTWFDTRIERSLK